MSIELGIVIDPLQTLNTKKDSTIAMVKSAWDKGWDVKVFTNMDMFVKSGKAYAHTTLLLPPTSPDEWCAASPLECKALDEFHCIIMRKDPPFNVNYIYTTYMLDLPKKSGTYVSNHPQSLRDCNEKFFITEFPKLTPPTLVSASKATIKDFSSDVGKVVIKPLHGMGGESIFSTSAVDENFSVIYETVSHNGSTPIMVQQYIPDVVNGDRRLLCIDGEPIDYALARVPQQNELRGNLAAGGTGKALKITDRERQICKTIGGRLRSLGLDFVGLDIIGGLLTEINVTSPTGIRELDDQTGSNIAREYLDFLETKLTSS